MNRLTTLRLLTCGYLIASAVGCSKQNPRLDNHAIASGAASTGATVTKTVYTGPFGLAMGISRAELQGALGMTESKMNQYAFTGVPPKPAEILHDYVVVATAATGVCRVMGKIDIPVVNATGDQLKEKADELAGILEIKYGQKGKLYDDASQDVYLRNPQFWMMGLKEDSVTYAYEWISGKAGVSLPNDIDQIQVKTTATSMDSGFASIVYTFKNFQACALEMKSDKASNL